MNEITSAVKFLFWTGAIMLVAQGGVSLKRATFKMAEAAVAAQEHPLSYGEYSRMLWGRSTPL